MKLDAFERERGPAWAELAALVAAARGRPERLRPVDLRRLGALYRAAAADLATARRKWPGDPVVARLSPLVASARQLVYESEPRGPSLAGFFMHGYWRLVREGPVLLLVAWTLLLAPAGLAAAWAWTDPGAAGGFVPPAFRSVTEPRPEGADLGIPVTEQAALSSVILTNNIRVSFFAFAAGIAGGLGTAFVLVQNGLLLGTVAGLAFGAGNGVRFVELVSAHGVLELSCIAVSAAAGMRLGWALVRPGRGRRVDALAAEARPAVQLVLGTAPWLVVAGLVEGFVTPAGLGLGIALAVGFGLGGVFWALVLWRGGPAPRDESRAGRRDGGSEKA
jgi:uncharacterized membrane protein SpoIIM required for sporulation